MSDKNLGEC